MKPNCYFCPAPISVPPGVVDIGGLKLCVSCYAIRSVRSELPCEICKKPQKITPNPLTNTVCCSECEMKADLVGAYERAYKLRAPCDDCGGTHQYHHATVWGQNLCHDCYHRRGTPCTQVYPGDKGYPAYYPGIEKRKPSWPALILPRGDGPRCVVCGGGLSDPDGLLALFDLPTICDKCEGPAWWAKMHELQEAADGRP